MPRSHQLSPFAEDFFDSAPIIYRIDTHIPVSPERAWTELTRNDTLDWCSEINSIEFTSPEPHGVETTRSAVLGHGLVKLSEKYFIWEAVPGSGRYRNAFLVTDANIPGLRRFGECTEVVADGAGSRLRWTFAVELATSSKIAHSVVGGVFRVPLGRVKSDTIKHFRNL
ncbi:SRPBCC family protein [Nocardia uniformis]|uniref:SRPBCC family protein n=2 Tax=Nocardia uniformis TaxID=53432 RepID=A0A849BWC0_9NOCA|nr:SRPBCC family protein [Nocardia uniformis]